MLYEFLTSHRTELVTRCQIKAATRSSLPTTTIEEQIEYGIPLFLDQLIKTLEIEQSSEPLQSRKVSGPAGGGDLESSEIGTGAMQHGRELLQYGFTIDQVVHSYGDICQAVTDLAFELNVPFEIDEFRTLNRCLDNAIAHAVTEFNYQYNSLITVRHTEDLNERIGILAHELRNALATALLALAVIKDGNVGLTGATGSVLDRSLLSLRNIIDRSLADVRMATEKPVNHQLFSLADFIMEVRISAILDAQFRECTMHIAPVDPQLAVVADRDLLFSAVSNILQNAFKFTRPRSEVLLTARAVADRILIEVEDHCGGLPAGFADIMFQPFTQGSADKSGVGLGLSIARRSTEANGGTLRALDIPGTGCIFTIDLPRHAWPAEERHNR